MEDTEKSTNPAKDSSAQRFSRQNSVRLESSLSASYVSQKSGSVESLGQCSQASGCDRNVRQTGLPKSRNNSALSTKVEDQTLTENGSSPAVTNDVSGSFQHWLNNEVLPSSVHSPGGHSTPVPDEERASIISEEEEGSSGSGECSRELFMPGDLHTPILGYETMEARSKFTVYKIHVEKTASEFPPTSWFVFRRYSDFVHLNDKLRILFPAFQLALPPKRWLRDNFDKDFLDSRRLGLQLFLDNITGHRDICNSEPVRDFFCTDDPPGPHDSLEESRALCDLLEESLYNLRQELQEKNSEVDLLTEELGLYKSQVKLLTRQLRALNGQKNGDGISSSASCSVDDLVQDAGNGLLRYNGRMNLSFQD